MTDRVSVSIVNTLEIDKIANLEIGIGAGLHLMQHHG